MPQFLYRVRPTRPAMLTDGPTAEESAAVQAHFEYLQRLTEEQVVLMAGRTIRGDESDFGIVVLTAPTEEEARRIVDGDPAVSRGVMRAEVHPYRVALWSTQGPEANDEHE